MLCSWPLFMMLLEGKPHPPLCQPHNHYNQPLPVLRMMPLKGPKPWSCAVFPAALAELNIVIWKHWRECSSFSLWPRTVTGTLHQACTQRHMCYWPYRLLQKFRKLWILQKVQLHIHHSPRPRWCFQIVLVAEVDRQCPCFTLSGCVSPFIQWYCLDSDHYCGIQTIKRKSICPTSDT